MTEISQFGCVFQVAVSYSFGVLEVVTEIPYSVFIGAGFIVIERASQFSNEHLQFIATQRDLAYQLVVRPMPYDFAKR